MAERGTAPPKHFYSPWLYFSSPPNTYIDLAKDPVDFFRLEAKKITATLEFLIAVGLRFLNLENFPTPMVLLGAPLLLHFVGMGSTLY